MWSDEKTARDTVILVVVAVLTGLVAYTSTSHEVTVDTTTTTANVVSTLKSDVAAVTPNCLFIW